MPLSEDQTTYEAAGGVIVSPAGDQVLLLIRPERDEVRLPKGHVEPGESIEQAAVRESQEETGYGDLEIIADLGEQLVTFLWRGLTIRRRERYYLMHAHPLVQIEQPEHDRQQFFSIWVPLEEAESHLTFEAEQEWVRRARAVLEDSL